jgi:type I restriction enzyme R subunit
LAELQQRAAAAPAAELQLLFARAEPAGEQVSLDEAATRAIIDEQLRQAGWEADSRLLTYGRGTRPQRGRNIAIAEWPTANGPADYVLFAGLSALAVVEAKRDSRHIPGSIDQAKRYSQGFRGLPGEAEFLAGGPWSACRVPFLFASNGRPYLHQLETLSGVWFLDARRPQNHPRALTGWYTPEGLSELMKQDVARAEEALRSEPPEDLSFLYPFQAEAVRKVEEVLADGQRTCLVAMATGTGKTRTALGLVYRLVKTSRFRRVLFLVDRSALGEQVANTVKDVAVDGLLSPAQIFDVKELGERFEADTKLQISTIQAMAKRLLGDDDSVRPKVDDYDCLVVDECHRGYLLDRELGEVEFHFRDQMDYISAYRRVLDHFDAVKIGLTATPALHTVDIFGPPVVRYTYRQAVLDNYLVDYEPPFRIRTRLAVDGMIWRKGEDMLLLNPGTNRIDTMTLPDEVKLEVDSFNKIVVTEAFNRAVCEEIAKHIDPHLGGKTIVFCVDDRHADLVVVLLKKAFEYQYGEIDDDLVQKITGAADRPLQKIRCFRNELLPTVAVTVDLLTTGIDVPEVKNLIFLRRVRSRILYEQMLGRATRLCPEIGKECFRIFDAVDLYSALEPVTEMRPVAVNPRISFLQLVEEVLSAHAGGPAREAIVRAALDQLVLKLQRKLHLLRGDGAEDMRQRFGISPEDLAVKLRSAPAAEAVEWLLRNRGVAEFLDQQAGPKRSLILSQHQDEIREVSRGFAEGIERPEEYLDAFDRFIRESLDRFPALLVVTQRPRDLTREQLQQVRLLLDSQAFSEINLRTAWREATNHDIAASIIGHIRRAALGDPLLPYTERVDRALRKILSSRPWTQPQREWLGRITNQIKSEVVVDLATFEQGAFKIDGGFKRLNKTFGGKLPEILAELQDEIWQQAV